MNVEDVLTNEFHLRYDEDNERLLLYRVKGEAQLDFPIEFRMSTLVEMGANNASKWVGETLLLLIPAMREKLFRLQK